MGSRTLLILHNPASGPSRKRAADWGWLLESAEETGWRATLAVTQGPGDAERLVREAMDHGLDRVVVIGGDGTLNEVVQPLVGTEVSVGLIPAGTSNILANELGIPEGFREAGAIALTGTPIPIDVGVANGRFFTLMVGVGFDALTTQLIWPQLKKLAGQATYLIAGLQSFLTHRATRMRIQVDGRRLRRLVYFMVIANTRLYGMASAVVAEHADVQDGRFDLCVFRVRSWYQVIFSVLRIAFRLSTPFARMETHRCERVTVQSARQVPYQIDGDLAGYLPLTVEMRPRALQVVARP
jgi:YegS/Rv2252/BmrU family lipid kinase